MVKRLATPSDESSQLYAEHVAAEEDEVERQARDKADKAASRRSTKKAKKTAEDEK